MDTSSSSTSSSNKKDFRTNRLDNFQCDEYTFCSNFDSGNLGRVELVKKCLDTEFGENVIHVEFNVWTTPDCYGTPNESPNRTWFFFSIKGGRPYRNVKINVKNLNRQSKLFSQGMQPVIRIGYCGKWERIKNKPTYNMEDENFSMSFIHQPTDKCDIEHFYAFTYPFTYGECQTMLENFDRKFMKSNNDINFIINKLQNTNENDELPSTTLGTTMITIITSQQTIRKQVPIENYNNKIPDNESNEIKATSSLEALKESITSGGSEQLYEKFTHKQLLNEIYYHREPLINSMEGRRVDLLTITSFHGIQNQREDRLPNLFPDPELQRCHTFKDKKIIFMSSRVHPGETPASFVLNGFLNLILDKKSTIAQILRQLYVFKIVPILNPDGVYRGFYRTDTLGQNLNRMYVNPKLDIHPSIYAVKKLIKYYHFGFDSYDATENISETSSSSSTSSTRSIDLGQIKDTNEKIEKLQSLSENNESNDNDDSTPLTETKLEIQLCSFQKDLTPTSTATTTTTSTSCSSEIEENNQKMKLNQNTRTEMKTKTFTETLIPEINATAHLQQSSTTNESIAAGVLVKQKKSSSSFTTSGSGSSNTSRVKKITIRTVVSGNKTTNNYGHSLRNHPENRILKDKPSASSSNQTSTIQQQHHRSTNKRVIIKKDLKHPNTKIYHHHSSILASSSSSNKMMMNKRNILSNHNTNSMKTMNITQNAEKHLNLLNSNDENTNMFLYIDFHGHASKKGVFMYGNHFSNSSEAVECMLLPRLMSINCHHFHYDACNFSERNMYRREKRDGLSKEGSGRVAIFKMTGLIKSYTLESNYNTGRYVNSLPARSNKDSTSSSNSTNHHTIKSLNLTPPKYTPAIYEEVGRALGPSILDITNSNTLSRIHNSEFRTIQGLRLTLRNEIERGYSSTINSHRNRHSSTIVGSNAIVATNTTTTSSTIANTAVVTTTKALTAQQNVKRIKRIARSVSSALPQNDISKENKVLYSISSSWDATNTIPPNPSTSSILLKSQSSASVVVGGRGGGVGSQSSNQKRLQIKHQRNIGGGGDSGAGCSKKITATNFKIRANSAPLYGQNSHSSGGVGGSKEFKKKSKGLVEVASSSSCLIIPGTKSSSSPSSFYIPPKKVKVSNRNTNFKSTTQQQRQSLSIPPPPPSLPSLLSLQNKVNNCLNCDVNNQSYQTDNNHQNHHHLSSSHCCLSSSVLSSLSSSCPIEAQNLNNACIPVTELNTTNSVAVVDAIQMPTTATTTTVAIAVSTIASTSSYTGQNIATTAVASSSSSSRFLKSRKTEPSSSSYLLRAIGDNKTTKSASIKSKRIINKISSKSGNKTLNRIHKIRSSLISSGGSSSSSSGGRKKRLIRHESIIIKRRKNKLKSTIH